MFFTLFPALVPVTPAQAQTYTDLQNLAFHPVSLESLHSDRAIVDPRSAADGTERIDMAMFEETASSRYAQDISALEGRAGSYAPELTEQLTSAGLLLQRQGRHEEAVSDFERAAASSRIHGGLYSTEQIVLAEHMIDSLAALGRAEEVGEKYEQLLTIHRRLHGPDAPQTAQALLQFGQWELQRLHEALAQPGTAQRQSLRHSNDLSAGGYQGYDRRFDVLYQAQRRLVDGLRILNESAAWTDPALFALEHNLVRTYYLDAYRARVIAAPLSYAADGESEHDRRRSMANRGAVPRQYQQGEQAYRRMLGYLRENPQATIEDVADVMLGLADWHLLFGQYAQAEAQYQELEQAMALVQASPAEVAALLQPAVPVTLPVFHQSALSPWALADTAAARGYVDLSFGVDRHGRATDLAVLGTSDGADSAVVDRLVTLVRNAHFRPAPDAVEYRLRYYFTFNGQAVTGLR